MFDNMLLSIVLAALFIYSGSLYLYCIFISLLQSGVNCCTREKTLGQFPCCKGLQGKIILYDIIFKLWLLIAMVLKWAMLFWDI